MSQRKIKKLKALQLVKEQFENFVSDSEISVKQILRENWKFILALCMGVILLYVNSLNGDFVSDDYATIPQNPLISSFDYAVEGSFVSISNFVIYKLFGLVNPFPYHLFNLSLYLVSIVLMFVFVYLILQNRFISIISTVIFCAMPIHVEAVSWISGKPYLISSITVLTSLILLILYLRTRKTNLLWMLLLSLVVCFYSEKVRFFSFIFIAITYIISFPLKGKSKINWYKVGLWLVSITTVVVIVIYPSVMLRINNVNSGTNASGSLFYDPFFQYPTSMAKYLQLMWFPADMTLYHTMYIFPNWLNWSILMTYLILVLYFYFKNKTIFFFLTFIFVASAPSMAPVKVSWLVAERYVFLGSLGFSVILGIIIHKLSVHFKYISILLFAFLVSIFTIRTYLRNIDWQTNHKLWVNTCIVSPNSHNAWNNIGDDYDKLKDYTNAIKGFTQSTVVKPNYADAYHNRANIFYKMGRLDLARESYNSAISLNPALYQTYMSLIQIDLTEQNGNLALAHAKTVVQLSPDNPQSWYLLGVVQVQVGQIEDSKVSMKKSLQISPGYKPAVDALIQLNSQT